MIRWRNIEKIKLQNHYNLNLYYFHHQSLRYGDLIVLAYPSMLGSHQGIILYVYIGFYTERNSKPPDDKTYFKYNSLIIQPFEIIFDTVSLVTSTCISRFNNFEGCSRMRKERVLILAFGFCMWHTMPRLVLVH